MHTCTIHLSGPSSPLLRTHVYQRARRALIPGPQPSRSHLRLLGLHEDAAEQQAPRLCDQHHQHHGPQVGKKIRRRAVEAAEPGEGGGGEERRARRCVLSVHVPGGEGGLRDGRSSLGMPGLGSGAHRGSATVSHTPAHTRLHLRSCARAPVGNDNKDDLWFREKRGGRTGSQQAGA